MITLDNLTRRFGATTAVDALTATIPAGAITALLGPNGAGKFVLACNSRTETHRVR